jgi:hypothetical protein
MAAPAPNRRSILRAIVTAGGVWALLAAPASGQIDAGLLAGGRDRDLVVDFDAGANRTEVRLTVAPAGTSGSTSGVTLVFVGRFAGRAPAGTTTLTVRTHITPRSDPRVRDPRTGADGRELLFRLDPHTNSGITLYLLAGNLGYSGFVPPGDEIPVAFFALSPAELRALIVSRAITGRALGSEFSLAPDQLYALGEFGRRVLR